MKLTDAVVSHQLPGTSGCVSSVKHCLPFLKGQHVLVRTDNTTTVAYNRQGRLRSRHLHMLAQSLKMWSSSHLSSLRATHVLGVLNLGADRCTYSGAHGSMGLACERLNLATVIWS